jgi:hypothetical protein
MSVKMWQEVERKVITALVRDALKVGYTVSVDNGEDETNAFDNLKDVMASIMQTDEDRLYIWKEGEQFGWVYLVYGNDGWDVISDYTVNLEHIMSGANKVSEYYE